MSKLETRRLIWVFLVAVLVNYLWELAQMPLYTGLGDYSARVLWHCFVASLGDGIMVLLIIVAGWITLRRCDWFEQSGVLGYVVMVTAGFLLALIVEWLGLRVLRRWEYSERMPLVPALRVGVAPLAQMLFLPLLISTGDFF
jgi:hypothetical protein